MKKKTIKPARARRRRSRAELLGQIDEPKLPHATLVIRGAAEMTPHQRGQISEWLNRKADELIYLGPNYGKRFRATFQWSRDW